MSPGEARRTRVLALAALLCAALCVREAGRGSPRRLSAALPAGDSALRALSSGSGKRGEAAREGPAAGAGEAWRDAVAAAPRLAASAFAPAERGAGSVAAAAVAAWARGERGRPSRDDEARARGAAGAPEARPSSAAAGARAAPPAPSVRAPAPAGPRPAAVFRSKQAAPRGARVRPAVRSRGAAREDEETGASERSAQARRARARPAAAPAERAPAASERPARPRRFKPLLLSKLWGRGSLRPPSSAVRVPDLARLDALKPKTLPGGAPAPGAAPPGAVEALAPPELDCRRREAHWHPAEALWHAGSAWGRAAEGGWAWTAREDGRWWGWTSAKDPAWLRWRERWWWRKDGMWFLLHDGEPWGYRAVAGSETFRHAPTGTELAYSRDGRLVAVVVPGQGALVYDAYTGACLGALTPSQLPPRPQPRAPARLRPVW